MSNYDDWKTESPDDEYERLNRPRHRERDPDAGGVCACGRDTQRSVAGIGWQCHTCYDLWMQQQYARAVRRA